MYLVTSKSYHDNPSGFIPCDGSLDESYITSLTIKSLVIEDSQLEQDLAYHTLKVLFVIVPKIPLCVTCQKPLEIQKKEEGYFQIYYKGTCVSCDKSWQVYYLDLFKGVKMMTLEEAVAKFVPYTSKGGKPLMIKSDKPTVDAMKSLDVFIAEGGVGSLMINFSRPADYIPYTSKDGSFSGHWYKGHPVFETALTGYFGKQVTKPLGLEIPQDESSHVRTGRDLSNQLCGICGLNRYGCKGHTVSRKLTQKDIDKWNK